MAQCLYILAEIVLGDWEALVLSVEYQLVGISEESIADNHEEEEVAHVDDADGEGG